MKSGVTLHIRPSIFWQAKKYWPEKDPVLNSDKTEATKSPWLTPLPSGTVLPEGFTPGPPNRDEGRVVACALGAGGHSRSGRAPGQPRPGGASQPHVPDCKHTRGEGFLSKFIWHPKTATSPNSNVMSDVRSSNTP